ncbi:MAG: hypothetical protein LUE23_04370 [Lachnospiraceae bacterium]|nr:hypothetical protein [Lachnospiraceae bacterium]
MTKENEVACKQIADHYGYTCQSIKCIEELSELIKAICKYDQSEAAVDRFHIIEELADVEIMTCQLIYLLGCEDQVQEAAEIKLVRQLRRMANDE